MINWPLHIATGLIVGVAYVLISTLIEKRTGAALFCRQCPNCGVGHNSVLLRACIHCKHPLKVDENNPSFRERVSQAIGKTLIAGIDVVDSQGTLYDQVQIHGKIIRVDAREGITILPPHSDQTSSLPTEMARLLPAKPGEYRLRSTGEVVIDPDFTSTWTLKRPR